MKTSAPTPEIASEMPSALYSRASQNNISTEELLRIFNASVENLCLAYADGDVTVGDGYLAVTTLVHKVFRRRRGDAVEDVVELPSD